MLFMFGVYLYIDASLANIISTIIIGLICSCNIIINKVNLAFLTVN